MIYMKNYSKINKFNQKTTQSICMTKIHSIQLKKLTRMMRKNNHKQNKRGNKIRSSRYLLKNKYKKKLKRKSNKNLNNKNIIHIESYH